jgi:signal transduction histidine kinase
LPNTSVRVLVVTPAMRQLLSILIVLLQAVDAHGQLTRAIDIRALPLERAAAGEPVELRGAIGFIESPGTVFVQDDTGGTFFRTNSPLGALRVGDVVEVKGTTVTGLYLTGIDAREFRVVDQGAPPAPQIVTYDDLASGRVHYQRVQVEGIGRRLSALEENRSLLHVALGDRVVEVRVDAPPGDLDLIDARVRVNGLAAGAINDRRQMVFPYLRVSDWSEVSITAAAPPVESLPITPSARLLRFGSPDEARHRVRVRGTVLASFPDGRLFLRDDTQIEEFPVDTEAAKNVPMPSARALAVRLVSSPPIPPSATVEVAGFPSMEGFSAGLADAIILPTASSAPASTTVAPVDVTAKTMLSGSHDADLVTLPATLIDVLRTTAGSELRLQSDGTPLTALLTTAAPSSLAPGTELRVTGICQIEASSDRGFRSRPERVRLLLRGAEDLLVVQAPSWWTGRRLIAAIGVLCGVILLGLLWITALRRQVVKQGLALRQRISHEAALEERQRIAREFHDTLEQELAGLSLRLDAATTRPIDDKARSLLDTSRHLVSRIQSEARNLVADLRDDAGASSDLTTALQALAARQAPGAPRIVIEASSAPPTLPSHIAHHLRMIAQEAVTNAIKHAAARQIHIVLSADAQLLTMTISDDGHGFDPTAVTQGQPGHFGCMGIHERCRKIGSSVKWSSSPSTGTQVAVQLPLPT